MGDAPTQRVLIWLPGVNRALGQRSYAGGGDRDGICAQEGGWDRTAIASRKLLGPGGCLRRSEPLDNREQPLVEVLETPEQNAAMTHTVDGVHRE